VRRSGVLLLATLALIIRDPSVAAQELEYPVKAAFLLNFARFTEWPPRAFESPQAPLIVCTFADNPFGETLAQTLAGERAAGHPLQARTIGTPADVRRCHMVFVPRDQTRRTREIVAARSNQSVVLIGERDGFLTAGGDINLTVDQGRVRFEINPQQPVGPGVRFSSHLLRLAKNSVQVIR